MTGIPTPGQPCEDSIHRFIALPIQGTRQFTCECGKVRTTVTINPGEDGFPIIWQYNLLENANLATLDTPPVQSDF